MFSVMLDKDPITRKRWYYTAPESMKNVRAEIPQEFKDSFAAKEMTCGTSFRSPALTHADRSLGHIGG